MAMSEEERKKRKAEYSRRYYRENTEKCKLKSKLAYQKNREHILDTNKSYRLLNKDKISAQRRHKRQENPEETKEKDLQRRNKPGRKQYMKEYQEQWRLKNKARLTAKRKVNYYANRHIQIPLNKIWQKNNRDRVNASARKSCRSLSDSYVKTRLIVGTSLTREQIPQSLIDAKREHLKIKRFLKEQENEQKEA